MVNGARGRRFDASYKRHPVTESSYINRLANRPYRSTIKTLPATLPEPWTMVRGPRSTHIGPWSTDLEPRIVDSVSRFKLRGSRLVVAGPGVTGDGCEIWIDLVRGVGEGLGWSCLGPRTGDGLVALLTSGFVRASNGAQAPLNNSPLKFGLYMGGENTEEDCKSRKSLV